jgi:lipid-A-disaccharide synthase
MSGQRRDFSEFKSVVIVAGEASADLHGSNLVKAIKRLDPDIVFCGIGGKRMQEAGVQILFSSSDMAVVGLTEVFSKLQTITRAFRAIKTILKNDRPDLLILIDYPGFNIHMAKIAKRFEIPVLYYISPQVWAWRRGRVKKISRRVDRMAVILPFEEAFYGERGMKVDFVGHPLLDALEYGKSALHSAHANLPHPVVGILPGSRKEEIRNLLPVMVKSAEIMSQRYPDICCLLPLAPTIDNEFVQSLVEESPVKIRICQESIYETLEVCDVALVASGTATLETAIMGVPMVIVYRVSPISYWVGRMVVRVPYIGLGNLVAGEKVVPELIQDEVTPGRLASEALNILDDEKVRANMIEKLKGIKERLGRAGASERTAKIALEMMAE